MDSDRHRRVKTVLLIVIGFLLLILGMVIGLLLGSVINDHSPGSGFPCTNGRESGCAGLLPRDCTFPPSPC